MTRTSRALKKTGSGNLRLSCHFPCCVFGHFAPQRYLSPCASRGKLLINSLCTFCVSWFCRAVGWKKNSLLFFRL